MLASSEHDDDGLDWSYIVGSDSNGTNLGDLHSAEFAQHYFRGNLNSLP